MDNYILCGMQYGDEGKGTFVDYLAHEKNADCVIRYAGGSQASHTVITPTGVLHKFSQLGSGTFSSRCHTYLTENMVVNLENLYNEMVVFEMETKTPVSELTKRIHIHEDCFLVTPYHRLIDRLRELSKGVNRRGIVGTGTSEVMNLLRESRSNGELLGLQAKDVFNPETSAPMVIKLETLQKYAERLYEENKETIWQNVPAEMEKDLKAEIAYCLEPDSFLKIASRFIVGLKNAPEECNFGKRLYSSNDLSFRKDCQTAIFESSQGLLIDYKYGTKPNTTYLDTTNHFASRLCKSEDKIVKIGISKPFCTRHGMGVFPTEETVFNYFASDKNQTETFWNGKVRYGWFDAVLLRYAQKVNQVDELYMSSIDLLDHFSKIEVCNAYRYFGNVDEGFKALFDYYVQDNGVVVITDVKGYSDDFGKYLENCCPIYEAVEGWNQDTSNCSCKEELPAKCLEYIALLEKLTKLPITVVSVGPTRENKIRM